VIGSGIEALSFRVEESLRHDLRFAASIEVMHGEFLADSGPPAAQERKRNGFAKRG
jgi:hypothetical protein